MDEVHFFLLHLLLETDRMKLSAITKHLLEATKIDGYFHFFSYSTRNRFNSTKTCRVRKDTFVNLVQIFLTGKTEMWYKAITGNFLSASSSATRKKFDVIDK